MARVTPEAWGTSAEAVALTSAKRAAFTSTSALRTCTYMNTYAHALIRQELPLACVLFESRSRARAYATVWTSQHGL